MSIFCLNDAGPAATRAFKCTFCIMSVGGVFAKAIHVEYVVAGKPIYPLAPLKPTLAKDTRLVHAVVDVPAARHLCFDITGTFTSAFSRCTSSALVFPSSDCILLCLMNRFYLRVKESIA